MMHFILSSNILIILGTTKVGTWTNNVVVGGTDATMKIVETVEYIVANQNLIHGVDLSRPRCVSLSV